MNPVDVKATRCQSQIIDVTGFDSVTVVGVTLDIRGASFVKVNDYGNASGKRVLTVVIAFRGSRIVDSSIPGHQVVVDGAITGAHIAFELPGAFEQLGRDVIDIINSDDENCSKLAREAMERTVDQCTRGIPNVDGHEN